MKFKSIDDLLKYTENIKGKTFREIDSEYLLDNTNLHHNKGVLGHVVETGFYLFKNKNILFIWYLYEKGKDIGDFVITDYQLYDMDQDMDVFENDFNNLSTFSRSTKGGCFLSRISAISTIKLLFYLQCLFH